MSQFFFLIIGKKLCEVYIENRLTLLLFLRINPLIKNSAELDPMSWGRVGGRLGQKAMYRVNDISNDDGMQRCGF